MTRPARVLLGWRFAPALTLVSAVLLLATGLGIGVYNERAYQVQKLSEAGVQAKILAASVSAALAFNDRNTTREYVAALDANPEIETAGVYDETGALVGGYARGGMAPPPRAVLAKPSFADNQLTVTAPVEEAGSRLGLVLLRTTIEPAERRAAQFGGLALLVIMALLVVAVLALAQGVLARANRELESRADELAEANRQLRVESAEREKAEEALRQGQRLEALGRLTGGVAHDFNNILMVASSGLDLLDRTTDLARRDMIRAGIRQAVERGASLTRQLLTFSRRGTLKPEAIDLTTQLEGMRVLLDRSLRENIAVEMQLPDGLWTVEADHNQLELAILNLAVNARDAMPAGGTLRIEAQNLSGLSEDELQGDYVRLTVTDTGAGIEPEQIPHVFEPFFTTKEVGKGTGLGLSQVYGFARGSQGDARISSEVGRGTAVSIYLPRSDKPVLARAPQEDASKVRGGQGRILLVEDDQAVASMVTEMLKDLGYEVAHASGAMAALDVLDRQPEFDLVFSDMVMPGGMNGIELAHELGRRYASLPVLLTTGFSPAAAAAQREGRRLLVKPYTMENLAAAVAATLRRRSSSTPAP